MRAFPPLTRRGVRNAAGLALLGLLALGALLLLAREVGRQSIQAVVTAAMQRAAGATAATEQFALRALDEARMTHMLAQRWVDSAAPQASPGRDDIQRMIQFLLLRSGLHLSYAILFDAAGDVAWASIPTDNGNVADRAYFQFHRDEGGAEWVGTAITGRASGQVVIPFTARLTTPEGAFAGVAYAPMNARALSMALETLVSRPGDVVAVIRSQGDIIARSADADRLVGRPLLAQAALHAFGDRDSATFRDISPVTGHDVVVSFRRLPSINLIAFSSIDIAQEVAASNRLLRWAVGAAIAAWGVLLGIGMSVRMALLHRGRMTEVAARQAGRDEIERLVAGLPAIIFVRTVDHAGDGVQLYRNGDAVVVSGWPAGTFPHGTAWSYYAAPGTDFRRLARKALEEGRATMDWQLRQPDGGYAWMRSNVRRLSIDAGGNGVIVGYILNVTAEREAAAQAVASARLASLGEMGAGLAHELKQPLTGIMLAAGNAQAVLRRGDTEKGLARVQRIIDLAQRGGQIIDHLRRFARGEERGATAVPTRLAESIGHALRLVQGSLEDARVSVETDLPDPAVEVLALPIGLEQVLVNLIGNARDAMADRPPDLDRTLTIGAAAEPGGSVRITVTDTGGGIPPEILPRLFEPFVTTKGPDRGTGLGLSVSRGLLKAMEGSIQAANVEGGARFTIILPAA